MEYRRLHSSALVLQTGARAMAARNQFKHRQKCKASTKIQAQWRRHRDYKYYKKHKKAVLVSQCRWRGRLGRKELKKLKMAAKETGALKEAKDKLEKKVEELTWRLQFEKRLRTDVEEAKEQEITKLQQLLKDMQTKVDEAKSLLAQERETKKVTQEAATTAEKETPVPVVDTEKVESLTAEADNLKALLQSQKERADDLEKKLLQAEEAVKERDKTLEETERKNQQLAGSLHRLDERMDNLEAENKILRQQALAAVQNSKLLVLRSKSLKRSESAKRAAELRSNSLNSRDSAELEGMPQKALNEQQQDYQETLIRCILQPLDYSKGRPVAATIIFKCLRKWRSFEVEKTSIFDRIIQTIGQAIEAQENNETLAYWLANTSFLLLLLQRTLKSGTAANPQRRRSSSASLFGRMTQSFRGLRVDLASLNADGDDESSSPGVLRRVNSEISGTLSPIDAKYPALLFKQQLTAYVEKIYGMIRDNLKREITPLLGLCIQAPKLYKGSLSSSNDDAEKQAIYGHWLEIVKSFGNYLDVMNAKFVPTVLIRRLYTQVFAFINVQLLNSLLLRRECCSFTNAEYVKAGLTELEAWCDDVTYEYVGSAREELRHIRQAISFLVIHQKPQKTLEEISTDLCPVLSIPQLYKLSTMYWDDKYGTHSVSQEVLTNMKSLMEVDPHSSSFLLDDDTSVPFSVDELVKSADLQTISDIQPPSPIREHPGFTFLLIE